MDISSWEYLIASQAHNISDYVPDVSKISGSQSTFDSRAVDALNALLKAAKDAGWSLLYLLRLPPVPHAEAAVRGSGQCENMREGDTRDEAETAAARVAAPPGTSDHQTGLGADVVDQYYDSLSVDTVNARFLSWLADNCADYGFVIRYPSDKVSITGRNEPWHVRYVGDDGGAVHDRAQPLPGGIRGAVPVSVSPAQKRLALSGAGWYDIAVRRKQDLTEWAPAHSFS
ncbi:MAG: M15 family metallopeptidase [Oscillospiraceae bacterium]